MRVFIGSIHRSLHGLFLTINISSGSSSVETVTSLLTASVSSAVMGFEIPMFPTLIYVIKTPYVDGLTTLEHGSDPWIPLAAVIHTPLLFGLILPLSYDQISTLVLLGSTGVTHATLPRSLIAETRRACT